MSHEEPFHDLIGRPVGLVWFSTSSLGVSDHITFFFAPREDSKYSKIQFESAFGRVYVETIESIQRVPLPDEESLELVNLGSIKDLL